MNETLSNYFAEHRFDAESQARLLERSGCANYDQFFNLLAALSGGTHCEELKSYLNGRDLNSNSVPIPSVKSSTFYAKSNSNVTSPRSSSSKSLSAAVQSKPVTKQSHCQQASVKTASATPKEYLKVKPASLLSSPPKEQEKTVPESQKSSLYHLSQLLPRSTAEESYQQCSSPKAGKVAKQPSLPEASSNNLLHSLSSPVHVASPVSSYARTKVESSPHVSTASVRDLYGLHHPRDTGGTHPPHQHLERTTPRSFAAETHVLSNSSRTTKDVSSKLTFDQNTSLKAQKAVKEKEYHQRERKLSLETPKEIRQRTDSVSSVGSKSSGVLDFQQQLHVLQLQQQFEYLQQLHKRNQSPSKLSSSRCKTETTIPTPNISSSSAISSMSEHEHRQAFLSWAASQLPVPPLPSSSGLAVSAVSTSVAAASPTSLPLATAKREPFNFVDTKLLKKERHPSGPATSTRSATPGVLSPPVSTARNTTTSSSSSTTFFSTVTSTATAAASSSSSVTPQSLPSPLSHWPLPPTPCTPTMPVAPTLPPSHTPFWLPHHLSQSLPHHQQQHHQFAAAPSPTGLGSVEGAGTGGSSSAGGPGLGYQVVTDPLSRHLILVHHAALQDVSSNLMWGYGGMAPLVSPQMLLTDPHFPRPLHPALLHASSLHPALHPSTPTLHPPTPTLHPPTPTLQPPSSAFPPQVVPSSISLPSSGVKTESPKASPKGLDDNSKGLIHGSASAGASSAYSNSLHSAIPPVMSAGLTTGLPGLPSSMTPGLPSPLSTAMPSVLSSVMPTGLTPGLASSLPPTLPHYLYPPSSLPLFCPKPPMYPLSAFVQTPTSPVISVITTATTASTNTSPSNISVHNPGLLGLSSKETDISQSSLRASMSLPTPPTVVLSPQLPKSPSATKRERAASSPRRSRTSTPTLVLQPKSSPSQLSSSTNRSTVPKIKLDNVQDTPALMSASSTNSKSEIMRSSSSNKIAIKKEIKEEYVSPITSTEKEHSCVDLSMNNHKIISNINTSGSIKQESGVPDSTKNSLNQSGVTLSSNVSSVNNDGSVHLPSLNSNPVVPDTPRINTAEVTIPVSSIGVTTATSTTTTSVAFASINSSHEGTTTIPSSPVPTYRHLSVQTVPQPPFYRHAERSSSVAPLAAVPIACTTPSTPKSVPEISTAEYNASSATTDATAFAPVQEQALDLSGLELLSRSVLQHANRLSSEEPMDSIQEESARDEPTDLRSNIHFNMGPRESDVVASRSVPSTLAPNPPSYSSGNDLQQSEAPLNFSMSASSESQSVRPENQNDFLPSSPPSALQPTGSRDNFIFLCALAEEELLKGNNNEKEESGNLKTVTTPCTVQSSTDSRKTAYSKEVPFSGKPGNFDATHRAEDVVSKAAVSEISTGLSYSVSSDVPCSTEAALSETTVVPFCTDTSTVNEDLSADSSPLDLSLGVSKKGAENEHEPSNCSSPKVSESELSLLLPSVGSNSPSSTRTSDGNHSCDSLITEKLLGTYDSSSSDSQNFEGFEDSSLRRTEENMRRQLVVLAKQYREKVRQVQRQFPKSDVCSSSHKSQRPSKRKRCPSESSRRSESRHAKHHRGKDGRKRLSSLQETVSCRRSSEDNSERKSIPSISISKLKSKKLLSPRHDSRMTGQRSSSDEENESSDDDNLPRRKWSLSFLSNDTKPSHTYKSHLLSPIAPRESDDERGAEEDFTDSSETNSKALNTETSAVESSDHETSFLPRSSSKKRKPGRPKKHSPSKKDATETIVTKKHKNLNLLLRHSSLATSKSKVKPKLKAEAREITFDAHESLDDYKDSPDENDGEADISFLKKVDSPVAAPSAALEVYPTSSSVTKNLPSLTTSTPIASVSSTNSCGDLTKRRKPGGSSSLTRRAIMRDKAKRKTDAEQQYQMEALFRSLKKRSTLANAEHDESEEEELDYDSDQSVATSVSTQPPPPPPLKEEEASHKVTSTEVVIKTETNTDEIELTDNAAADVGSVTIKTETTKDALDTNVSTSVPEVGATVPLGLGILGGSTRTPSVCHLAVDELVKGCRVLLLRDDGLLYAGSVNPITPPDLYDLIIDGERGNKGHIYCAEELLTQAWKEVKPGSTRFLKEGTRVCCFWSQQYRALYSGTVGSASTSPAHSDASSLHNFVNVEFDDGDSGRIHVDDIRLLPQDYPVTVPKPNPLLTLCTRKRRAPQRDSTESRPIIPSCSSFTSTSSSTSVKLTVTTSASGMCRVTSSTTSTVNASQYGSEFADEALRSKKSRKAKKKKKTSSKKQQKRLSREWEEESANGSDAERNDVEKPIIKKIKLSDSEVKKDNLDAISGNETVTDRCSVSLSLAANSVRPIGDYSIDSIHTSELGKSSKKKKKKHSKSEESSHKKRKHKHKKNKNRHDDSEPMVYKCDTGSSQGTVLTIHSAPADTSSNQMKVFPHVEQVDGDLRVRIKSPPPNKLTAETVVASQTHCNEAAAAVQTAVPALRDPSLEVSAVSLNTEAAAQVSSAQTSSKSVSRNQKDVAVVTSQRIKECREKAKKRMRDSNRPKRSSSRAESVTYDERSDDNPGDDEESSGDDLSEEELSDDSKTKIRNGKSNISGKKSRHHSGRSKIAAFLPEKDLWKWSGKGSKKTTGKGRGRKIFYKEIVRGDETIRVGDCCVFRSSGPPDNPYIGRIEHLCEGWGGSKSVTVHWFYHPNEIQDEPKKLKQPKGALFESNHRDTNDLQTISYKCQVLPLDEYRARHSLLLSKLSSKRKNVNCSEQSSGPVSSDTTSGECCTSCNASSGVLTDALDTSVETSNSCINCVAKDAGAVDASSVQIQADSTIEMRDMPFGHETPADSTLDEQNNVLCKTALFGANKKDEYFKAPLSKINDCAEPFVDMKVISREEDGISTHGDGFVTESSLPTVNGTLAGTNSVQETQSSSTGIQFTERSTDNHSHANGVKPTSAIGDPLLIQHDLFDNNDSNNITNNSEHLLPSETVCRSDTLNSPLSFANNASAADPTNNYVVAAGDSHQVSDKIVHNTSESVPENNEAENESSSSLVLHSSSSADSSSSEDSDDENDALNECYYLAGTYDVIHQVLRMEPGVE